MYDLFVFFLRALHKFVLSPLYYAYVALKFGQILEVKFNTIILKGAIHLYYVVKDLLLRVQLTASFMNYKTSGCNLG